MGQGRHCGILIISAATLNASGFYRCFLSASEVFTHGTYLQVYKPLEKTIQLSESVKNGILTAEGVLLLLCVLLPSVTLLFKGLDLDHCAAYDQIVHQQERGPYEDVGNNEDIQLEQP
uniref:Uncharacterized protein n=1 Tax=Knipowitschia caucasica TaxID=637954 RepID=A0AAV2MB69_KNICA